ncbi:mechanosensitive ion channel family protein [Pontibacter diazotrophicus]|uniref:mechanosensitive ion channel n=1 Tax=Pontibacter diazotrophicus TaxID=1400979 RepID=UPI0015F19E91|nr:mechanosensitive ion channel [Pontibacter diazotrophicus]
MTNLTQNGLIRMDFIVGIDYNDNIKDAIDLIESTALQVEGVLQEEPPYATVDELGTSTVNIKVFFWAETNERCGTPERKYYAGRNKSAAG